MNQFPTDETRSGNRISLWTVIILSLVIITARFVYPVSGINKSLYIAWANVFFVITGMWVTRKILTTWFTDLVTTIILILIIAGTNLFCQATYNPDIIHSLLFLCYSLILWLTIRWHATFRKEIALSLGLILALTISIRSTEIICILIPLFWGIYNKNSFYNKWNLIKQHPRQSIGLACIILLSLVGEILHHDFLYRIFDDNNTTRNNLFIFLGTHLPDVLFSFRKGWLIYTPVMFFSIIGFYFLAEKNPFIFYSAFLYFLLNLYFVSSWNIWWDGDSFGQRSMISSYPVMAIPLAYFTAWLYEKRIFLKLPFFILLGILVCLNLFQTWQYTRGIIDPSHMTRQYYSAVFGDVRPDKEAEKFLLKDASGDDNQRLYNENLFNRRILVSYDFDQPNPAFHSPPSKDVSHSGSFSYKLYDKDQFSPGISEKFSKLTNKEDTWIRTSGYVYFPTPDAIKDAFLVITCNHKDTAYKYQAMDLEKENLICGKWNKVTLVWQTPYLINKDDLLQSYFWYPGKKSIYVDDVQIEISEPAE